LTKKGGIMQTKQDKNVEQSPFYGLFQKHPWLVPLLLMFRRQIGIFNEFIEVHVKPHNKKENKKETEV